ncbi:hypothetical protein FDECE_871 [Fusarium decemcellulare]|nr:hypothetical protein FDECE_871 [Fusarium decemcellulare]
MSAGLALAAGPFIQPALHFQFLVRHGASLDRFLDVIIPFSCVINQAIVTDFKSKDEAALDTLIAFRAMDLSELHDNINMRDDDAKDLKGADLQSLGRIPLITKTVRHMRVEVDWDRVFEVKSLAFYRDWQELGRHWQEVMSNPTIVAKPYTRYLTGVRTTYKDLAFNNLGSLTPEERPDRPVPATSILINGEHRTVSFIAGAAEEQEMHDARAVQLLKTPLPAVFIRDVFSKWQAKDSDVETYGIAADGRTSWLSVPATTIFLNCEHRTVSLIVGAAEEQEMHDARAARLVLLKRRATEPKSLHQGPVLQIGTPGSYHLGDKCTFFVDTPSANRKMPSVAPTAAQIGHITLEMVRQFHFAEQRARRAEDHCNEEIRAAGGKNDDSRVQYLLEHLDEKRLQAFIDVAGQID